MRHALSNLDGPLNYLRRETCLLLSICSALVRSSSEYRLITWPSSCVTSKTSPGLMLRKRVFASSSCAMDIRWPILRLFLRNSFSIVSPEPTVKTSLSKSRLGFGTSASAQHQLVIYRRHDNRRHRLHGHDGALWSGGFVTVVESC